MSYLRKKGEPKPIMLTSQEIAITFWCIALLFAMLMVFVLSRRIIDSDTGEMFYFYDAYTLGFVLFMILFFSFFGIVWLCWGDSKFNLNMWKDRINPDWQGVLRADKNGLVTGQIMKKDSLGYNKGIAFGKKAGLINKGGFKLTLPNGNNLLLVVDFMSRNIDLAEAIGWMLYKRKHGFVGYNAYVQCKREKKTLLSFNKDKDSIENKPIPSKPKDKKTIEKQPQFYKKTGISKKGFWERRREKKLKRKGKPDGY